MSFNHDELEAPKWLDSEFLVKVLEFNGKLHNVKISDYKISPATMVGDHYASIMFRVFIDFLADSESNGKMSIVLKTIPHADGPKKDLLSAFDVMGNEIHMYTKVLPICQEILKNIGLNDLFYARLLYYSIDPQQVIVFEDLKELDYFMLPRQMPTEDVFKIIYSKLAQFHATTFKMDSDGFTDLRKKRGSIFNIPEVRKMDVIRRGLTHLAEMFETIAGFQRYAVKLRKIDFDRLMDICETLANKLGPYNVLNHGDYHVRNMMFKNNTQKVISEVILVDFQVCHWGSPAIDIIYMDCIVPHKLRENIHRHYFDAFTHVLEKLRYKGKMPTYQQLLDELKRLRYLDLLFLSFIPPFMLLETDKIDFQMDTLLTDADCQRRLYKNPVFVSHAKEVLERINEEGVLDQLMNSK